MALQPGLERLLVPLQGIVVAVVDARIAAPLAAFLRLRLAGRRRSGIAGVAGEGHPLFLPGGQRMIGETPLDFG